MSNFGTLSSGTLIPEFVLSVGFSWSEFFVLKSFLLHLKVNSSPGEHVVFWS